MRRQDDHDLLDAFLPLPHPTTEAGLAQTATDLVLGLREIDEMSGQAGRWHDGGTRGAGGTGGLVLDAVICASGGWEGDPPPRRGRGGVPGGRVGGEAPGRGRRLPW